MGKMTVIHFQTLQPRKLAKISLQKLVIGSLSTIWKNSRCFSKNSDWKRSLFFLKTWSLSAPFLVRCSKSSILIFNVCWTYIPGGQVQDQELSKKEWVAIQVGKSTVKFFKISGVGREWDCWKWILIYFVLISCVLYLYMIHIIIYSYICIVYLYMCVWRYQERLNGNVRVLPPSLGNQGGVPRVVNHSATI